MDGMMNKNDYQSNIADYYYQIKAKDDSEYSISSWAWPPVFSGKVSAENKKQAKSLIEEEYDRKFPQRVLKNDLENHHYLLNIREIEDDDERTRSLFYVRECNQCETKFRRIDLYNDHNEVYKGGEFCGIDCKNAHYEQNRPVKTDLSGNENPVIYRVLNIKSGMSYIGKTTQVFTLRWYQHFYHGGDCKFHKAIKESNIEDWQFSVVESVNIPNDRDRDEYVAERERFWINKLNSIDDGYNSVSA